MGGTLFLCMYQLFGDEISSGPRLLVCTVSNLTVWGERMFCASNKEKTLTRTVQIWEGQTGGEDGYLSAGGLLSLFCSRVLEELTWASSPAFYPLPASVRSVQRQQCVSSHDSQGWTFCPCMCLHECWL